MRIKEQVKEIDSWLADVLEEEQVEPQEREEHLITEDHCTDTDTPKVLFYLFFYYYFRNSDRFYVFVSQEMYVT